MKRIPAFSDLVVHDNTWRWGRSQDLVLAGGAAIVSVSVEKEIPDRAWVSGLSVCAPSRRKGLGKLLLNEATVRASRMGAKTVWLRADPDSWLPGWYERHGFKRHSFDEDGYLFMYKYLNN